MTANRSLLILLPVILLTGICGTVEADASWLSGYSYRVRIPVNAASSGAQTDYQMQIILHSKSGDNSPGNIYLNGNLQDTNDFNDIRFTASDSNTLKDFWIQQVVNEGGGRRAFVYVKLDTPASGSTDYYLYYGKSDDASASNYDNTFTKDYGESGLVGLWHMDEGTGAIVNDFSGNSNTGTIYGGTAWQGSDGGQWDGRSDVVFSTGSALQFDGVNDYVDVGNAASLDFGTNDFTIELWAKATGGTSARGIVNKGGWYSIGYSIQQAYSPENQYFFVVRDSVGYKYISLPLYETWGWSHLVAVKKSNYLEAWVNNVKVGTYYGTIGSLSNPGKKFEVGRSAEPHYFNGTVDEVRIYNRALSADEISRHFFRSKYASTAPKWANPRPEESYALNVTTQSATYIGLTSATLNGYLSGFGGDTSLTVYFKWGLSQDDLNHTTASQILTDYSYFNQPITDLSSDTTYYFQAFVENSSGTAQGSIVSFKTEVLETDYYGIIINTDGSLTFTCKDSEAAILSSVPKISLSYLGYSTVSNGDNLDSILSVDGDFITITSVDDTNPYARITHQYELNVHSPYIDYAATFEYKQNVYVTEERFDFVVLSQDAQVMTRDLELTPFDISETYWSDLYTPKVVRFTNGLSFLGSDTMESMRLRASGSNSQVSFYSDYGANHPHFYYIKYGGGTTTYVNETQRAAGDTYSASVTFAIDTNESLQYLVKARQPYGYDATLTLTNHPDGETLSRIKAVAYGSEEESDPDYGTKGIAGRGIGWTKGVFVWGAGSYADLSQPAFKALIDQMYQDGVIIVGHSITPGIDIRTTVAAGLATLAQYNARGWIDHSASGGNGNFEDLASQGAIKGSYYYILDLLDQYNYQYAWSYIDLTTNNYALNMLKPSATSDVRPFLFYNNRVDDNVYDNKRIYLWSTVNTQKKPDYFYTCDRVDNLISERGIHIGHEYFGYSTCENHVWYNHDGIIEIWPTFDFQLGYIAEKRAAGLIWSPPRVELGDYLVPLKDVLVTYNNDGSITVTNNSITDLTGITLLAENNIQSVTIDNYDLVSFGGSYGDREMVLPTIASGDSVVLNISYGTKDASVPTIVSNDTGRYKVNEITGYWDAAGKTLIMTAEGRSGNYSFTVTIPSLANKFFVVKDVTLDTIVGQYRASESGAITFTASLGFLHTFKIEAKPFVDNFNSYLNDCGLQDVWHSSPLLVWLNTDPNFVRDGNSMEFRYESNTEVGASIEDLPYKIGANWTVEGVKALSLFFYGDPCNSVLPMYVRLKDGIGHEGVVTYGEAGEDPNDLRIAAWHEWNIDLAIFDACGVDMTDVEYIYLGFGAGEGSGAVYFDDIQLYPARCVLSKRSSDFARVDCAPSGYISGDCVIDFRDFAVLANEWLNTVDFEDIAVLADVWLEEQLWP